jgi:ATPase subunit of ABC transporter with duplicated ATPase domains
MNGQVMLAFAKFLPDLFGGFDDHLFERTFLSLSGGERRRVGLAKLLIDDLDLNSAR